VIYRWRFHTNNVQLWADVIENCNNGSCGSAGAPPAWIKGPKFIAGVRNTGKKFTQITVWGGGKALCAAAAANPFNATGQCSAAARSRFQFNYATPKTLSGGGYDPAQPANCTAYVDGCFSAVFESLLPDDITYQPGSNGVTPGNLVEPWYNGTGGMNNWANDMDYQQAESTATNCNGNVLPSSQERWESVGDKLTSTGARGTYADPFTDASGFAFGWEDCTTVESAQSLYRAYENEGMDYGTYASFGFAGHYVTAG